MNHAQKIATFALLACVQVGLLGQAQSPSRTLAELYPELIGPKAKATIVSFTARW